MSGEINTEVAINDKNENNNPLANIQPVSSHIVGKPVPQIIHQL